MKVVIGIIAVFEIVCGLILIAIDVSAWHHAWTTGLAVTVIVAVLLAIIWVVMWDCWEQIR